MLKVSVRVGPAGWSYPDWMGIVYPKPKPRGFHEATYLAEFFDTIELNTTFYSPAKPEHARQWVDWVSNNPRFSFTAKLWRRFTHEKSADAMDEQAVRPGLDVLQNAGKLGALLVQFPFSFHNTRENFQYLTGLLGKFKSYPRVVEVRHSSWNDSKFYEWLREKGIGFCNIDQPIIGRSLKPSSMATSAVGYIRLHGQRYDTWFQEDPEIPSSERYNYLYSEGELAPWLERIQRLEQEATYIYVVLNNHFEAKALVNAFQIVHKLTGKKQKIPEPLLERYPELEEISLEAPRSRRMF